MPILRTGLYAALPTLALAAALGRTASAADTFTVTDPSDDFAVDSTVVPPVVVPKINTLRWAIDQANANPGSTIAFNIPGDGPVVIRPHATPAQHAGTCDGSSFRIPTFRITAPVTIDGYSQNRNHDADQKAPLVEIDGIDVMGATDRRDCINGILLVRANGSVIRGLAITRFGRNGMNIDGSNDVQIAGNYIGIGYQDGVAVPKGNGRHGVVVEYTLAPEHRISNHVVIGGPGPRDGNLVSANGLIAKGNASGIDLDAGALGAIVQNNLVGTDPSGVVRPGFGNNTGIIAFSPGHKIIGNNCSGSDIAGIRTWAADELNQGKNLLIEGNYISANAAVGISLGPLTGSSTVRRNVITGGGGVHNNDYGGIGVGSSYNLIEENEIVGNGRDHPELEDNGFGFSFGTGGIVVEASLYTFQPFDPAIGNQFRANVIARNVGPGIEIMHSIVPRLPGVYFPVGDGPADDVSNEPGAQTFANHQQNRPVITSAVIERGHARVRATLWSQSNATFDIEIYAGAAEPEPQGETLIGTVTLTTDANGNGALDVALAGCKLPAGTVLTATATNLSWKDDQKRVWPETSEFSDAVPLVRPAHVCDHDD